MSGNATKHGLRSAEWVDKQKQLKQLLRRCRDMLETLKIHHSHTETSATSEGRLPPSGEIIEEFVERHL